MPTKLTIKYKITDNIILGTDEKGNDVIIYLNEKIPNIKDNNLIINLNKENHKLLLNMNEINFNIKEKIQKLKIEIFQYELKELQKDKNPTLFNFFTFLLEIKFYKECILNKLFGKIPINEYEFLKDTYRLDNILIDYLIDLEKFKGLPSEDKLKIRNLLYMDTDFKDILFLFFRDINLNTTSKKIIEKYESFNRMVGYLLNPYTNNRDTTHGVTS